MIILFMVFIVQFSVSSACLAINKDQQVSTHTAVNHNNLLLGARGTKPTFQTKTQKPCDEMVDGYKTTCTPEPCVFLRM
jgi:hypothetical protein